MAVGAASSSQAWPSVPPAPTKRKREIGLIGVVGGLFPPSTVDYYVHMNTMVRQRLGGQHAANVLIYSVDQNTCVGYAESGRWDKMAERLTEVTLVLERAGAKCCLIACNSVHKVFAEVQAATSVNMIHIGDSTMDALHAAGCTTVGWLGTRYTLEAEWLQERLSSYRIVALHPNPRDLDELHELIMHELNDINDAQQVRPAVLRLYRKIVSEFKEQGAMGVVLGCTELQLLAEADQADVEKTGTGEVAQGLSLFNTSRLHAAAAVDFVLGSEDLDREPDE